MLSVEKLTRSYGNLVALDDVSFTAKAGEVLGFLGPNGAGKSTAMKIITGYMAADSGKVFVGDLEVHEHPMETRALIGALPENNPLYEDMEAREYLAWAGSMRGMKSKEVREAITRVAAEVGLSGMLAKPIRELSRGYRQRTGFAAALLHDPDLLILDEPTSGLDPSQIVEIHELMRSLADQGKAIVFSTHILSEVDAVAHRLVVLHQGRVLANGTALDVARSAGCVPKLHIRSSTKLDEALLKTLRGLHGVHELEAGAKGGATLALNDKAKQSLGAEVFALLAKSNLSINELRLEEAGLNDAFRALVRNASTTKVGKEAVEAKG